MDDQIKQKIKRELDKHVKQDINNLDVYLVGSLSKGYGKAVEGEPPYDADIVIQDNFTMEKKEIQEKLESNNRFLLQNYQIDLEIKGTDFGIHVHQENLDKNEKYKKLWAVKIKKN